jgi:hypothetical protein
VADFDARHVGDRVLRAGCLRQRLRAAAEAKDISVNSAPRAVWSRMVFSS